MAASKENPSCSSSSASTCRHASFLRSPLSPIHHNSSSARPPEHPTPASRRPVANPSRAPLPPLCAKSPPLLPPHLTRNSVLPRSPNPNSFVHKLPRDGGPSLDLTSRFKAQKDKERTPLATPRNKSSIQLCNPVRSKHQTQLFVQQKAALEPFFVDKSGASNQRWMEQMESKKNEKPCRKKWRRYPRESVLRSLRGGDGQANILGLATTGTKDLYRDVSTCSISNSNPKEPELPHEHGFNMMEKPCQELSFDVYAGGKFLTDNHSLASSTQSVSQVSMKEEEEQQEAMASLSCRIQTCNGATGSMQILSLPADTALTTNRPIDENGSPNRAIDESLSLTLTPPPGRSFSSTPPAERNLTPPMQPTQSPDFIKREGMRALLPIDGTCYAAPCNLVKDRRKCKPRGVLTVDTVGETLSSAESELGFGSHQSVQQMPTPAVASVEWMLDEKRRDTSPELVSASTDLCRMSFPRLSPYHFESLSEQQTQSRTCQNLEDAQELEKGSFLQASLSLSGYEWGASSSQGMFSSCRTEASSANPRRSIVFDDGEDVIENEPFLTKFKSTIMHNALFEECPELCSPSMVFSDEESDECLLSREAAPLEGSPPFEYSLLSSLNVMDTSKMNQRSWSKCLPEEVMLSMSGPMDSSLSSQEHEHDGRLDGRSSAVAACNTAGPLVCFQGGKSLQMGDSRPFDMAPELQKAGSDISSRLAMAKFLCNITATYLDDIATCLGTGSANGDLGRAPSKETTEKMDKLSLEQSSLMAGRKKMAECCSLLRGLTLETSKSRESSSMASECSVNQPSPSLNEDTADSSMVHVNAGCSSRTASRFPERIFSPFDSLEDDPAKASPAYCVLEPSLKEMRALDNLNVEVCLPSKGFVAGAYLLAGLFTISHTYCKHIKRAGQRI